MTVRKPLDPKHLREFWTIVGPYWEEIHEIMGKMSSPYEVHFTVWTPDIYFGACSGFSLYIYPRDINSVIISSLRGTVSLVSHETREALTAPLSFLACGILTDIPSADYTSRLNFKEEYYIIDLPSMHELTIYGKHSVSQ